MRLKIRPDFLVGQSGRQFTPELSAYDSQKMLLTLAKIGMRAKFYEPVSDTEFYANPIDIFLSEIDITKELINHDSLSVSDYLLHFGIEAPEDVKHGGWCANCLYENGESLLDFDNILTNEGVYYIRPYLLPCDGYLDCL